MPTPSAKGHVKDCITLLAGLVAELTPNEQKVDSHKGHGYKETDQGGRDRGKLEAKAVGTKAGKAAVEI